ncbi:MAG: hypothetical protein NWF01_05305 [Candidatus Bathyarchaeota archaeon]|nr:hypothetical protein [Candidatus Bathyarchaeota archaeon]
MKRQKTLALLREILEVTNQVDVEAITLLKDNNGDYALKINCFVDDTVLKLIQPILKRNNLTLKHNCHFIIISSTKNE